MLGRPRGDATDESGRRSGNEKIWPLFMTEGANRMFHSTHVKAVKPFLAAPSSKQRNPEHIDESFHRAISPLILVAQFFGQLPISGVGYPTTKHLAFKLGSFRCIYAIVMLIILTFMASTSVVHMVKTLDSHFVSIHGGVAAATAGFVFYTNSMLATILFMWLATHWAAFQRQWAKMEEKLNRNRQVQVKLLWKFRTICFFIMIAALIEHIFSLIINFPTNDELVLSNFTDITWKDHLKVYSYRSHAFILSNFEYNIGLGVFLFIISKIATFIWNFTDLFIILVSTGLSERYKAVNNLLLNHSEIRSVDWYEFRDYYATLSSLVKRTDSTISPIILLSFVNNLYFVCLQLLNGLMPKEKTSFGMVYFFYSFAFLIARTVGVTLFAAQINDQSKLALPVLYNCTPSNFTHEAQRLQFQLNSDEISLTGLRFFSITRNFMLAVAGAIVTYEVVLLQFNVAMNK